MKVTDCKSIMSRTFRIGSEGEEDAGKTEEVLGKIGIEVRKSATEFRALGDILKDLEGKWNSLTNIQKTNISQTMAGVYHISKFTALMDNFSIATEATDMALNSQGSAMRENERYMASLEGQIGQLKATTEEFYASFMKAETFGSVIEIVKGFIIVAEWMITNLPMLPIIITAISLKLGILNRHFKTTAQTGKLFGSGLLGTLIKIKDGFVSTGTSFGNFFKNIKLLPTAMGVAKLEGTGLSGALRMMGVSAGVATAGLVALEAALTLGLAIAITLIVGAISKWISNMRNADKIRAENIAKIEEEKKSIDDQRKSLEKLSKEYEDLYKKVANRTINTEEFERLKEIQDELAKQVPNIKNSLTGQVVSHDKVSEAIKRKTAELEKQYEIQRKLLVLGASERLTSTEDKADEATKKYKKVVNPTSIFDMVLGQSGKMVTREDYLKEYEDEYAGIEDKTSKRAIRVKNEIDRVNKIIEIARLEFEQSVGTVRADISSTANIIAEDIIATQEANGKIISSEGKQFIYNALNSMIDIDYSKFYGESGKFNIETLTNQLIEATKDVDFSKFQKEYVKAFDEKVAKKINPKDFTKISDGIKTNLTTELSKAMPEKDAKAIAENLMRTFADGLTDSSDLPVPLIKPTAELVEEFEDLTSKLERLKTLQDKMAEGNFVPEPDDIVFVTDNFKELLPYLDDTVKSQDEIAEGFDKAREEATKAYHAILFSNEEFTKVVVDNNRKQINDMADNYGVDRDNWKSLAEFKLAIDQQLLKDLAGEWSDFYSTDGELQNIRFREQELGVSGGIGPLQDEQQAKFDKAREIQEEYQNKRQAVLDKLNEIAGNKKFKLSGSDSDSDSDTGRGKDFNQDYMIDYGAEVDKIDDKLSRLNVEYELLEKKTDNRIVLEEKLNEILDLQVQKQKALETMADKISTKRGELKDDMIGLGIDPTSTQDEIDSLYKNLSKSQKQSFSELYKDWKTLDDQAKKAGIDGLVTQKEQIATIEELINKVKQLADEKFRLYGLINAEISGLNASLQKNQTLMDRLEEGDNKRLGLINERVKLLKQSQDKTHLLAEEKRGEREDIVKVLKTDFEVSFTGTGDDMAVNAYEALEKQKEIVEKSKGTFAFAGESAKLQLLNQLLIQFIDIQSSGIPSLQSDWASFNNEIKDSHKSQTGFLKDVLSKFNEAQEGLGEIMKDSISERKKAIEDEFDDLKDTVQDKIDELQDSWDDMDYQRDEEKQRQEITDIMKKKSELLVAVQSGDLTAMGQLAKLEEEEAEKREKLGEMHEDRSRDLRKDALKDKIKIAEDEKKILIDGLEEAESKQKIFADTTKLLFADTIEEYNKLFKAFLKNIGFADDEIEKKMAEIEPKTTEIYKDTKKDIGTLGGQGIDASNIGQVSDTVDKENVHPFQRIMGQKDFEMYVRNKRLSQEEYDRTSSWGSESQQRYSSMNTKIRERYNIGTDDFSYESLKPFVSGGFATGGVNDKSGLYAMHGTSGSSEVVFNSKDAKKLFDFITNTQSLTSKLGLNKIIPKIADKFMGNSTSDLSINFENLLTVEGNVDSETLPRLNNLVNETSNAVVEKIRKELSKSGFKF